jgi:signal transduction histidine kinase
MKNKSKIITTYKDRLTNTLSNEAYGGAEDNREAVLLGELQIAQLELEMQNDELSMAVSLLESQRAKFEGFFNLAPTAYFIIDQLGQVEEVNNIGIKMLKSGRQKLIGQRLQSFILPEDYELFYDFLQHLEPGGDKNNIIVRFITPANQIIHTRVEGIALIDHFNAKLQFYITASDITESRISELELKEATQRLELTLSASGIGTWTVDSDSGRLFLDKYSLSLLGISPWEFDHSIKSFFDLVHPNDQPLVKEVLRNAFRESKDLELEFRISPKNNPVKNIRLKGISVKLENEKPHIVGIIVDITEAMQIEGAKRELDAQKQKLIFEATFSAQEKERERISSALHDSVCQLLYGIRLNLQHIQESTKVPPDLKNINQLIAQAIKETRNLSYELTPSILIDFGFVAAIKEMISRLKNRNFQISTKIKSDVDKLSTDLQLSLFRTIQELLNNCIKHAQASRAEIVVCTENEQVTLIVSDNGTGFQQDSATIVKGSGLRSIRNRIFLLNGTVDIDSSKSGTKVIIKIKNVKSDE